MSDAELLIGLLAAVSALVALARRWDVAAPILLFVGGTAAGAIPGLPHVRLHPDLLFLIFLPPLVYYAAFVSSPRELRAQATSITLLAVGLVLATLAAVAVVVHAIVPGLPWAAAFALGAILGPTDPVAATTVIRRVGAPPKLITLLEGEALVNDGVGLVAYKLALTALATGAFSLIGAVGHFLAMSAGGIGIGLAVGWLVAKARQRLDDAEVEITLSLATPYVAYIPAEAIGASGVLASVTAGLFLGAWTAGIFTPQVRLQAEAFWRTLTFLLTSVLFLLVGLQFRAILHGIATDPPGRVAAAAVGVCATVIAVRLVWQEVVPHGTPLTGRERFVVGWSGMRGAVSLGAALALPLHVPQRDLLIFLTFCAIFATLVLQGLTLPFVVRRLGIEESGAAQRREMRARRRILHAALSRLEDIASQRTVPEEAVDRLRSRYEGRLAQLDARLEDDADSTRAEEADAYAELRKHLIEVERSALGKLHRKGTVDSATARRIRSELDVEELQQQRRH